MGLGVSVGGMSCKWEDLSSGQRCLVITGAGIEIVLTTVALVDLVRRPAPDVRGPKVLWGVACFVQPVGPVVYLLLGRRRAEAS